MPEPEKSEEKKSEEQEKKPTVTIVEDKSKLTIPEAPKPPKISELPKEEEPKKEEPKKEEPKKEEPKKEEPKKSEGPPKKLMPKLVGKTLDTLSIGSIDGIGPKVEAKLNPHGIKTVVDLVEIKPSNVTLLTNIAPHTIMSYQTKAAKILDLDFEVGMVEALAAEGYTIEKTIAEDLTVLERITGREPEEVLEFLRKVIEITMYLDATTCRNESISILLRFEPKSDKEFKAGKAATGESLDSLSVEAIHGVDSKIAARLNDLGIMTLFDLTKIYPAAIYRTLKIPLYKLTEWKKKSVMILTLKLDESILDKLAEQGYTIAQLIEEDPDKIRNILRLPKEDVVKFLEGVVQIAMFLNTATLETNSVSVLRVKVEIDLDEDVEDIRYLGREQILAKIYSNELDYTIFTLLRERARNKGEILKILENRLMNAKLKEVNRAIDLLVQTELVSLEWFQGSFDVHLFLISDFAIFRTPVQKVVAECEKNRPSPLVAEQYLTTVQEYFENYKPNYDDNLLIAKLLGDPDVYVTLTLLRNRMYPLKKFPKGMKGEGVDMLTIIQKMEKGGLLKIFKDETKEDWVLLLTDIRVPQFYPEYLIESIRTDYEEKKVSHQLAIKHLNLLELHYDTFSELSSQFYKE